MTEDSDLRVVTARVLRAKGYSVTAAAHSGHAILASLQQAPFDVLVIEQQLAEGSSRSIIDRLQRYNPDLRTVRLYDHVPDAMSATDVVRPFTADDLLNALRAAVPPSSPARG
jgi:ActR/RegA family two-component response regulator